MEERSLRCLIHPMQKILKAPWYLVPFSLFPVLSLLSVNIAETGFSAGLRSLLVACLGELLLCFIFWGIYRSWQRAVFTATMWGFLFFAYGQVFVVIYAKWKPVQLTAWLLSLWFFLFVAITILGGLRRVNFGPAALPLNIVSVCLLIYPLFSIVHWSVTNRPAQIKATGPDPILHIPAGETLPDIYYIMPEDYGRADLLQSMDQIDTSQFIQFLKDSGFYVAECSQSNYATSELSLGSSLNMQYLQDLGRKFNSENIDQTPIWNAIRYSSVSADLKAAGYSTVAFATGFTWSELNNADVYIKPSIFWSDLSAFEIQLLRTTPLRHLEDAGLLNLTEIDGEWYRERTTLEFNSASTLARMPGPKFVFMHIISPHEPFVFGPNGEPIDPAPFMDKNQNYTQAKYKLGFQDQVPYDDSMLEKTITTLIRQSTRPLVIILQTDTGPLFTTGADTFKILNAYYMPGHSAELYPSISPVNTFRAIFDSYLGADLPLLKDVSYYSPIPHIYDFSAVPNPCSGK
jgi:hypothetical protein